MLRWGSLGLVLVGLLILNAQGLWAQGYDQSVPNVTDLSCDGKGSEPDNVSSYTPMFSWVFSDADAGDAQTAFEIRVGTSPGGVDLWQMQSDSATSTRMYGGSPLLPNTLYYWSVQVKDRAGQPSGFADGTFKILDIGLRAYDGTSVIKIAVDDEYKAHRLRIGRMLDSELKTFGILRRGSTFRQRRAPRGRRR
jgi:hypothetical protein